MGACTDGHSGVWAWVLAVPVAGSTWDRGTAGTVMSVPGDTGLCRHSLPGPFLDSSLLCSLKYWRKWIATSKIMPLPALPPLLPRARREQG